MGRRHLVHLGPVECDRDVEVVERPVVELLGHVVGAQGVLEGQVELVLLEQGVLMLCLFLLRLVSH